MRRVGLVLVAALLLPGWAAAPAHAQSGVSKTIRYGEVVSVTRTVVKDPGTQTGATVGATAGAVAGYALVGGRDRWLGGLIGGALGGAAGRAASAKKRKGWELIIKVEGGSEIAIDVPGKKQEYFPGERVRMITGGAKGKTELSKVDS
jgi:outer membrane lipoprotein SlyB